MGSVIKPSLMLNVLSSKSSRQKIFVLMSVSKFREGRSDRTVNSSKNSGFVLTKVLGYSSS